MKTKIILLLMSILLFLPEAHAVRIGNRLSFYERGRKYKTPAIPYNWVHVKSDTALDVATSKRVWRDTIAYYRSKGIRLVRGKFLQVRDVFPEHRYSCEDPNLCCVDYECLRTEMINGYFTVKNKEFFKNFTITHYLAPKIFVLTREAIGGLSLFEYHKGGYSYSNGAFSVNGKSAFRQTENAVGHEIGHAMYLYHIDEPVNNIMNADALHYVEDYLSQFLPLLDESRDYMIKRINFFYRRK